MLILEDDVRVGNVIKLMAEVAGLEARLYGVTGQFLAALEEWQPTHIALDLVMPDVDGNQVLAELALRKCTAKIIITSGMGSRVLEAAARAGHERGLNILGVLAKPFSGASMRAMLLEGVEEPEGTGTAGQGLELQAASGALFHPPEADLRRCVENREFRPVYQPKIECATGRLAGFEALARWYHPLHGVIMPDQFIPLLNRSGLIDHLTDAVLDAALPWFSSSYGASASITLAVNFSVNTFSDPGFVDRISERCRTLGLSPGRLIVELNETDSMDDPIASLDHMARLRMRGFLLSIDDVGTGYSSLLQLVRLPFSEIKIDRSFLVASNRSTESRAVVKFIVDLGRSLGIKSAAEGVEDAETLEYLRQIGCDLAQGYAIARPMDGPATQAWVAGRPEGRPL
jgi:EAL domain-containing protein (putative c-di-GMP-specific phosphodiesterase class I)